MQKFILLNPSYSLETQNLGDSPQQQNFLLQSK